MSSTLSSLLLRTRRKIFVSYHHGGDQWFYNEFSRIFHDAYETVFDNSLERRIDSDDVRYVLRRIREAYIVGTSCTVVLCGAETPLRKYVDWEIKATLDKPHGLVGVVLPTARHNAAGQIIVPDRLNDNIQTGYASWLNWADLNPTTLANEINAAIAKSPTNINNSRVMRQRNG